MTMFDLPLFPLHSVLFPAAALKLHVFELRYRQMIGRCLKRGEPFGVLLIRDGREVGQALPRLADVGTTAIISEVGRYPDGRMDIVAVGGVRFRVAELVEEDQPFLVARVEALDEEQGDPELAQYLAHRVARRFFDYVQLLDPSPDDGPEIEIELEIEVDADDEGGTGDVDVADIQ
jgi:Lon protease-like protein